MRILVHDYAGHPFQVQLSRELAWRGHDVLHQYYGHNNTPKGNLKKHTEDSHNLVIEGVYTQEPIQKYSFLKRWLQDLEYGNRVSRSILEFSPDIFIAANTPLDALRKIAAACRKQNSRFVFWLQDVSGLAAHKLLKQKIPLVGGLVGQYHIRLEKNLLRNSDAVVLIAYEFKPIVESWGVRPETTRVIPNWAPLNEVPVREKNNPWAIEHGLTDKFCFLYTGGMGLKHNPNLILQLALAFREREDVCVSVVSEGLGASWLGEKKIELGVENLKILNYQPFEQMPDVLAAGDVLVAILEPDAGIFSVPSKVLTYLCAQRPLLLAVPSDNLSAKIVQQNNTGHVVPPGAMDDFLDAAERLYTNAAQRDQQSKNARAYAEAHFNIEKIGDQFEELFTTIS